jgi:hypothetical protein
VISKNNQSFSGSANEDLFSSSAIVNKKKAERCISRMTWQQPLPLTPYRVHEEHPERIYTVEENPRNLLGMTTEI